MSFEQLAIQSSREKLINFCLTYDKNYVVNWHHRALAEALERVESGETKRLIIEMPPRHGKSQLASIYFPAWYLGRNPDKEIITCSYSADLAKDFGGKTRNVVKDAQYQNIFGTRLQQDSTSKDKWHTQDGGSYTSVGVGGPITGRGANVLIIDDPLKNREEAESQVMRDKIWDWYTSTAYTRLEKDAAVIVITTRWHMDDLVGRLKDREGKGGDQWETVRFPAISTDNRALWPEKYDLKALDQIKKTIGVYDWNALYQQKPISSETQEFHKSEFRYFTDEEVQHKDFYYYAMVDPAVSQKETADNSAIVVVAKEKTAPEIYIVDVIAGKFTPGRLVDEMFLLKAKYKQRLIRVGIETVAFQQSMMFWLTEEMRKREKYFEIVELRAKNKKEIRIRGLKPMYEAEVIFHRTTYHELEEELLTFPNGLHDDRIDALAYIQQVLKPTKSSKKAHQFKPRWAGTNKPYANGTRSRNGRHDHGSR